MRNSARLLWLCIRRINTNSTPSTTIIDRHSTKDISTSRWACSATDLVGSTDMAYQSL